MKKTYLTNLKIYLTSLVVIHHASQSYSLTDNNWPIKDSQTTQLISSVFDYFSSVNNSYFMALFFLISGIFIPASLVKYGTQGMVVKKIKHLLVPSFIFMIIVFPLFRVLTLSSEIDPLRFLAGEYFAFPKGEITFGHTWYMVDLFIFILIYIPLRRLSLLSERNTNGLSVAGLILIGLLLSISTFLIRSLFQPGFWLPLHLLEPARVIIYFSFFLLGTQYKRLPCLRDTAKILPAAIACSIALLLLGPVIINVVLYSKDMWAFGFNHKTLVVSVWDCFTGLTISCFLLLLFKKYMSKPHVASDILGKASFGVYLLHPFVVLFLQVYINELTTPIMVKFALSAILSTGLCYLIIIFVNLLAAKRKQSIVSV